MPKKLNTTRYPGFLRKEMTKKMRYLNFGPAKNHDEKLGALESFKEAYEVLYDSATNTPHGFTKQETRVFGRVLSKLESVGVVSDRTTRVKSFDLCEAGGTVALEEAEFDILNMALNEVQWQARFVRKADSLYEWLRDAPSTAPIVVEEAATAS